MNKRRALLRNWLKRADTERGHIGPFIAYASLVLVLLFAGVVVAARIAFANNAIQKAADAAALAAAAEIDVPFYREYGEVRYAPTAYGEAMHAANSNNGFLAEHNVPVEIVNITLMDGDRLTAVTVSADVSSILPQFVPYQGGRLRTGVAETRIDFGP